MPHKWIARAVEPSGKYKLTSGSSDSCRWGNRGELRAASVHGWGRRNFSEKTLSGNVIYFLSAGKSDTSRLLAFGHSTVIGIAFDRASDKSAGLVSPPKTCCYRQETLFPQSSSCPSPRSNYPPKFAEPKASKRIRRIPDVSVFRLGRSENHPFRPPTKFESRPL